MAYDEELAAAYRKIEELEGRVSKSALDELLSAESILATVSQQMADEYKKFGKIWPRDWMQKHSKDRQTLLDARNILLERSGR